jgi:hypothetical protein
MKMGKPVHGDRSWDVARQKEIKTTYANLVKDKRQPDADTYRVCINIGLKILVLGIKGVIQTYKQAMSGKDTAIKKMKKKMVNCTCGACK